MGALLLLLLLPPLLHEVLVVSLHGPSMSSKLLHQQMRPYQALCHA
jgi:hypothetical protein